MHMDQYPDNIPSWPEYPKVLIKDDQIFIQFIDRSIMCWGSEKEENIISVAEDIENGLKAIQYLTDCITHSIYSVSELLKEKGCEEYQIKEYLKDAFRNVVHKYNPELENNKIYDEKTPYYVK